MSSAMYDSIDSLIEAVEKLLATVPDHAKEKLMEILEIEKARQEKIKELLKTVPDTSDKKNA